MTSSVNPRNIRCMHLAVRGAVQGVGFRPWIFRLAHELGLAGWVQNTPQGVVIEVEGPSELLDKFLLGMNIEPPPLASIQSVQYSLLNLVGYEQFIIRESGNVGAASSVILPDIAPCPECLAEMNDPANRRHAYPFINCTNCGPRYSIMTALPYDRPNTTMAGFAMCDACRAEYDDPRNRRFHAQPIACPNCGPHLTLVQANGAMAATGDAEVVIAVVLAILAGDIVALKGVGGFQLLADARNPHVIHRLRRLKGREHKPFALMYPSIEMIRADCLVSGLEERLLLSPESPIVLLDRRREEGELTERTTSGVESIVAPGSTTLGIMLPSSPLHHLLMNQLAIPVVATSGNEAEEPICIDNVDAMSRLREMADLFLIHNRPIRRHVDDSIVRVAAGREMMVRRARGYAPLPVPLPGSGSNPIPPLIAVGAHLKNTIAVTAGANCILSQHIGDLETPEAHDAFRNAIEDLSSMYAVSPSAIVADLHPDYLSTQFAAEYSQMHVYDSLNPVPVGMIQHHYAHIAGCMADNGLEGEVLGVAWDGTGLGTDGTIWGGEFLHTDEHSFQRVGTFRRFYLPGGDRAVQEPRRAALGLLYELYGEDMFHHNEIAPVATCTPWEHVIFRQMLKNRFNTPFTSSAGRLFDVVASLMNLFREVTYEGEAAIGLENLTAGTSEDGRYDFTFITGPETGCDFIVDWEPMIHEIIGDHTNHVSPALISARFHNTLVEIIVHAARRVGCEKVVMSGGCFQNRYLLEHAVRRLREEGFSPYWPQRVPTNDGGIAYGQIYAYMRSARHPDELIHHVELPPKSVFSH